MIRKLFGVALIAALSLTLAAPAVASRGHGGGFHGGSHHGFHHHGFHHCCFGPAFFGGVFVTSSLAFPLSVYPYYYPYPYTYPVYPPPVYEQAPPAVLRDVCYVEGCYCGIGSSGVPRPSLADYVLLLGPTDGAAAARGG
jgi:hypothetical protein